MQLTLITPTSDRPEGIALAKRWLRSQRLREPVDIQWLVCDDGVEPADLDGVEFDVEHIRLPPSERPADSFRQNIAAGLEYAKHGCIAFWEDDDWYPPTWLAFLIEQFQRGCELIGEAYARYYNVANGEYRTLPNRSFSCLCQTAISRRVANWLARNLDFGIRLDIGLWRQIPHCDRYLQLFSTVVGIKGLPGKPGLGIGHQPTFPATFDDDGSVLRKWIGDDADEYRRFLVHCEESAAV